jgi:hypothetical protein
VHLDRSVSSRLNLRFNLRLTSLARVALVIVAVTLPGCAGTLEVRGIQGVGSGKPAPPFTQKSNTKKSDPVTSPTETSPPAGTLVSFEPSGVSAKPGSVSARSRGSATTCNGHSELCDRRYDEVAFPMTHNSFAIISEGFRPGANANQSRTIQQQLRDGIRVFMLNTYQYGDVVMMCHGSCMLGMTPHQDTLRIFESFLEAHPQEVITIIYEDFITQDSIEAEFENAGLLDYVYTQDMNKPWPTLGEMVTANDRLVVMAENRGGGRLPWYHDAWQLMWDTPYGSRNFSCELNRGSRGNSLFLMNHWANTHLSLPSASNASVVNQESVLMSRANQCAWEAGRIPNFVAVDFYDRGGIFEVVDQLNGVGPRAVDSEASRAHSTGGERFSPE